MGVLNAAEVKWEAEHKEESPTEAEQREARQLLYLTEEYNRILESPEEWQLDVFLYESLDLLAFLKATFADSERGRDFRVVMEAVDKLQEAYRGRCKALAEIHKEDAVFLGVL